MLSRKRRGLDARTVATTSLVAVWFFLLLAISVRSVVSFLPQEQHSQLRSQLSPLFSPTVLSVVATTRFDCETSEKSTEKVSSQAWLDKGLLLSSFTDGLASNPSATDWLMNALVEALWKEEREETELALKESNLASPCNGPDPVLLGQLEDTDDVVEGMANSSEEWKTKLESLCEAKRARMVGATAIDLRVLYIPTAMYALRPGSTSKPGKQRGRNRADGKKRRNDILRFLAGNLEDVVGSDCGKPDITVQTVTMDFDDASVKQPEEVVVGSSNSDSTPIEGTRFPESGKEAIREWKPHLVYVQGGNTFWLHHCMEKGDWARDLVDACCCDSSDKDSFSAVYCGVSAGAILAGESMQTACWKEWDDSSVVPGKETYGDWTDTRGLCAAGQTSVFPHMMEEWADLAERKTKELVVTITDGSSESSEKPLSPLVRLIRDDQAFAVDGSTRTITEL